MSGESKEDPGQQQRNGQGELVRLKQSKNEEEDNHKELETTEV